MVARAGSGAQGSEGGGLGPVVVLLDGAVEVGRWPLVPVHPDRLGSVTIDLGVVDVLARLHLGAARLGLTLEVRDPCSALFELLGLAGLDSLLGSAPLPLEPGGEPEGGEQLRVEEAVEPDDEPV